LPKTFRNFRSCWAGWPVAFVEKSPNPYFCENHYLTFTVEKSSPNKTKQNSPK
jgi:hypothetical protein